jgi:Rrf2 family protein
MQVALGKRAHYGIRAVLELSRQHNHGRRKSREIAAATAVPPAYLARILATLSQAGLVASTAGPAGGYELTRGPAEVTMLAVIEVMEGESAGRQCMLRGIPCASGSTCSVHDFWIAAQSALNQELEQTTFADIIDREGTIAVSPAG